MNGYGKKGGTGPTAGKSAKWYEFTTPEGDVLRRRSFHVDQPEAVAIVSRDGTFCGIHAERPHWAFESQVTVPATRVDGPAVSPLRRGLQFRHKRIIDAQCVVTRVCRGMVYYKVLPNSSSDCFPVDQFDRWAEIPVE
jgi:hypothetical protein